MAQYYTLEEAAQKLGLTTDAFRRKLATEWKSTPRRYPDGATLRFQVREIDELARTTGQGSDSEVLADAPLSLADSSDDFLAVAGEEDVLGEVRRGPDKKGGASGKLPKSPSDSDVRLESGSGKIKSANRTGELPTEEIDLDAEQAAPRKPPAKATGRYEVAADQGAKAKSPQKDDAGSEFELSLTPDSSDEFDLKLTDDDSDEVEIGTMPRGLKPGDSGINLQAPADSGISLEKSSSSEFELQIEGGSKPKKPSTDKIPKMPAAAGADSSSEFELTLDDGGAGGDATTAFQDDQKDIFETDFELPALDDESGSEAVALEDSDTDVESSDFDLALDEGDAGEEEASGSEVVAIEEDDEAPRRGRRTVADAEELDELEAADDVDLEADEEELEDVRPARAAAPASWGALPAVVLLPCVLVMFLVGVMGYELLHSMWGYHQPVKPTAGLVRFFAETFGEKPAD